MNEEHSHDHAGHQHTHSHPNSELDHEHGWHGGENCWGDDTFGVEANPTPPTLGELDLEEILVFVPYVPGQLRDETLRSLPFVRLAVDLSGSQYNYWELVRRLWARGADFILVEQDIVLPSDAVRGFNECPEPWCVHDYEVFAGKIEAAYGVPGAFGCVRFRAELLKAFPNALEQLEDRTWSHLDGNVSQVLRGAGFYPHRHLPDAVHLHEYPRNEQQRRDTLAMHRGTSLNIEGSLEEMRQITRAHSPMLKAPSDLARYEAVLLATCPEVVVETGYAYGGSSRWFAERVDEVISIELNHELIEGTPPGAYITILEGSSTDPTILAELRRRLQFADRVLVSLDSDHSAAHVAAELEAYAPFVTPGSYLVVEDGIIDYLEDNAGYEGSPLQAIRAFLEHHPEFEVDSSIEEMFPTSQYPSGWLRRTFRALPPPSL